MFARTSKDAVRMLEVLTTEAAKVGLTVHVDKTCFITNAGSGRLARKVPQQLKANGQAVRSLPGARQ